MSTVEIDKTTMWLVELQNILQKGKKKRFRLLADLNTKQLHALGESNQKVLALMSKLELVADHLPQGTLDELWTEYSAIQEVAKADQASNLEQGVTLMKKFQGALDKQLSAAKKIENAEVAKLSKEERANHALADAVLKQIDDLVDTYGGPALDDTELRLVLEQIMATPAATWGERLKRLEGKIDLFRSHYLSLVKDYEEVRDEVAGVLKDYRKAGPEDEYAKFANQWEEAKEPAEGDSHDPTKAMQNLRALKTAIQNAKLDHRVAASNVAEREQTFLEMIEQVKPLATPAQIDSLSNSFADCKAVVKLRNHVLAEKMLGDLNSDMAKTLDLLFDTRAEYEALLTAAQQSLATIDSYPRPDMFVIRTQTLAGIEARVEKTNDLVTGKSQLKRLSDELETDAANPQTAEAVNEELRKVTAGLAKLALEYEQWLAGIAAQVRKKNPRASGSVKRLDQIKGEIETFASGNARTIDLVAAQKLADEARTIADKMLNQGDPDGLLDIEILERERARWNEYSAPVVALLEKLKAFGRDGEDDGNTNDYRAFQKRYQALEIEALSDDANRILQASQKLALLSQHLQGAIENKAQATKNAKAEVHDKIKTAQAAFKKGSSRLRRLLSKEKLPKGLFELLEKEVEELEAYESSDCLELLKASAGKIEALTAKLEHLRSNPNEYEDARELADQVEKALSDKSLKKVFKKVRYPEFKARWQKLEEKLKVGDVAAKTTQELELLLKDLKAAQGEAERIQRSREEVKEDVKELTKEMETFTASLKDTYRTSGKYQGKFAALIEGAEILAQQETEDDLKAALKKVSAAREQLKEYQDTPQKLIDEEASIARQETLAEVRANTQKEEWEEELKSFDEGPFAKAQLAGSSNFSKKAIKAGGRRIARFQKKMKSVRKFRATAVKTAKPGDYAGARKQLDLARVLCQQMLEDPDGEKAIKQLEELDEKWKTVVKTVHKNIESLKGEVERISQSATEEKLRNAASVITPQLLRFKDAFDGTAFTKPVRVLTGKSSPSSKTKERESGLKTVRSMQHFLEQPLTAILINNPFTTINLKMVNKALNDLDRNLQLAF